jgi:hypothetical protein
VMVIYRGSEPPPPPFVEVGVTSSSVQAVMLNDDAIANNSK